MGLFSPQMRTYSPHVCIYVLVHWNPHVALQRNLGVHTEM
jgi:hypothetical protein